MLKHIGPWELTLQGPIVKNCRRKLLLLCRGGNRGLRGGWWRSRGGLARSRRARRLQLAGGRLLVIKLDDVLGNVNPAGGVQNGRVRVAHVEDDGIAVLLGIALDHLHQLTAKLVNELLRLLLILSLRVFYVAVEALGLGVDLALHVVLIRLRHGVRAALQLLLEVFNVVLLLLKLFTLGPKASLEIGCGGLAVLGGLNRGLNLNHA